ncbi:MAG: hypothetical protein ACD_28C00194G0003, partial [uncultured bacterium]
MKSMRSFGIQFFFSSCAVFLFLQILFHSPFFRAINNFLEPFIPISLIFVSFFLQEKGNLLFRWRNHRFTLKIFRLLLLILPGLTISLFFLPVFRHWCQLPPSIDAHYSALGGIIPWSDAAGYYNDSFTGLYGNTPGGMSARRPLNFVLFVARLGVTGNLSYAILLNAGLLGISIFFLVRTVFFDCGLKTASCLLGILYGYGRWFVSTVLTETLGLTLAVLAINCFWVGIRQKKNGIFLFGFFLQVVALNARAGAFFVLPTILIFCIYSFWNSWRERCGGVILVGIVVFLGFLLQGFLFRICGVEGNLGHGNFPSVVYGIVTGGRGWTAFAKDYSDLKFENEREQGRIVLKKSLEAFSKNPKNAIIGIVKNSAYSFPALGWNIYKMVVGKKENPSSRSEMIAISLLSWLILLIPSVFFFKGCE